MISFKCDNCSHTITDYCGENFENNDEHWLSYTCPHCGKTFNLKEMEDFEDFVNYMKEE